MQTDETTKKPASKRKRLIWGIVIGVVLLGLVVGGIEVYRILYTPQALFNMPTIHPTVQATQSATPEPTPTPGITATAGGATTAAATPSPSPTPSPTPGITDQTDILNILLIGVDRSVTVGKLSGNDPHADVMMVVAINFKKKKVDLISLPRDTFVHAPEIMNGIYKLNASFNVGGGFKAKNGGGFLKVCEAAEYMLGGIPVDYYYAVDFSSLVKVINTIGGVDYEVESRAYSHDHKKGKQHMDGTDVLFYVRSRKVGPEQGDPNRVNRQKKMMIAVFKQLKAKGKLTMLPDLLSAANNGLYTNTTVEQTLALANYANSLGTDKIGMYSMIGHYADKGGWRYCFTEQKERKELIKKVYSISVPEQVHCSMQYADWVLQYGLSAIRYQKTARQLLDFADTRKAAFTADQKTAYNALADSCARTKSAYDRASISMKGSDNRALANEKRKLRTNADKLAKLLGYKEKLVWTYNHKFWLDPAINEVEVDFR